MTSKRLGLTFSILLLPSAVFFLFAQRNIANNNSFIVYTINPKKDDLNFYWKDENNQIFGSIQRLNNWMQKRKKENWFLP